MRQRVHDGGRLVNERRVPVQFETTDGNDHFHLMRIMRYSLRAGNGPSSPEVAPVSSGWRDDYGSYLALQWADVSDTTAGSYHLAADADPNTSSACRTRTTRVPT